MCVSTCQYVHVCASPWESEKDIGSSITAGTGGLWTADVDTGYWTWILLQEWYMLLSLEPSLQVLTQIYEVCPNLVWWYLLITAGGPQWVWGQSGLPREGLPETTNKHLCLGCALC